MNRHTLKKLLDKRKASALLEEFLAITPDCEACWVVDDNGKCLFGVPGKTKENFHILFEKIVHPEQIVVTSFPYTATPITIGEEPLGLVVAQHSDTELSQNAAHMLRYLRVALTQLALLGAEKREILDDALDKYREITLLYSIGETISSSLDADRIATMILEMIQSLLETESSSVLLLHPATRILEIKAASGIEQDTKVYLKEGIGIAGHVAQSGKPEIVNDTSADPRFIQKTERIRSILCVPLKVHEKILGVINVSNKISGEMFTARDEKLLMTLASQAAVCIINAQNYEKIKRKNIAFERFVPTEFLSRLGKKEVEEITLGEVSKEKLSVLFSDIRSFTSLSEIMTPEENFRFLNNYLKYIGPVIEKNGGFIDKYIGDAIMALFSGNNVGVADDAIVSARGMLEKLREYNQHRQNVGYRPIAIGIGIHTGPLMLGTIGFEQRMESTVIGDTVNLASRMEGLTKQYAIAIAITSDTFQGLMNPASFLIREIDTVQVKGKKLPITVYEEFNSDPDSVKEKKIQTLTTYHDALHLYKARKWRDALQIFTELQSSLETDQVIKIYRERCQAFLDYPPEESWDGVVRLREK
ncbi:MAG: GAF domain-containing protein [bacterium]|nr:GAF domain-containing protein [bacterium]